MAKRNATLARLKYQRLTDRYKTKYQQLYLSKMDIMGLPETISERYVKDQLLHAGRVVFVKTLAGNLVAIPFTNGLLNYNDEPTFIYPVFRRGLENQLKTTYPMGEFVIVYDNERRSNPNEMIKSYIDQIINVEKTIALQLKAHKIPINYVAPDDKTLTAIKATIDEIDEGVEDIITTSSDIITNRTVGSTLSIPYVIDRLYSYKAQLEAELKTDLGIDNDAIQKNSGVSAEEVNANNDEVSIRRSINIKKIAEGLDEVNKLFGTKLSVNEGYDSNNEEDKLDDNQ